MIAVQVGGLDDQRVTVVSQDNAVDWCCFANCAHVPGGGGNGCISSHQSNRRMTTEATLFLILNPIMLGRGGGDNHRHPNGD